MAEIDVLYAIHTGLDDDDFFQRFKYATESLNKGTFQDFQFCVSDTSPISTKPILDSFLDNYRYVHVPNENFSRAYTINLGVKELITAPYLKINDADLVYKKDHLELVYNKSINENYLFITNYGHRLKDKYYSSDYEELMKMPIDLEFTRGRDFWLTQGTPFLKTSVFYDLNGFDEEFTSSGYEDADFETRARMLLQDRSLADWPGTIAVHLWHERNWNTFQNKNKWFNKRIEYRKGIKQLNEINPNGWGLK